MNDPLVEAELVLRATDDLAPTLDEGRLRSRLEVVAGLEVPDSRHPGWLRPDGSLALDLPAFVADDAAAAVLVHGTDWRPLEEVELHEVGVVLLDPSGAEHPGSVEGVLGDPVRSVRWLVTALARRGEVLEAGTVMATGSATTPVRAVPGEWRARWTHGFADVAIVLEGPTN